jgi:hypothetical protein
MHESPSARPVAHCPLPVARCPLRVACQPWSRGRLCCEPPRRASRAGVGQPRGTNQWQRAGARRRADALETPEIAAHGPKPRRVVAQSQPPPSMLPSIQPLRDRPETCLDWMASTSTTALWSPRCRCPPQGQPKAMVHVSPVVLCNT